jgi:hypothetical protein
MSLLDRSFTLFAMPFRPIPLILSILAIDGLLKKRKKSYF